jgi:hypothetical protein
MGHDASPFETMETTDHSYPHSGLPTLDPQKVKRAQWGFRHIGLKSGSPFPNEPREVGGMIGGSGRSVYMCFLLEFSEW